jgi:hypothetical protein
LPVSHSVCWNGRCYKVPQVSTPAGVTTFVQCLHKSSPAHVHFRLSFEPNASRLRLSRRQVNLVMAILVLGQIIRVIYLAANVHEAPVLQLPDSPPTRANNNKSQKAVQPSPRRPIRSPDHVFWCGYPNLFDGSMNMGELLFPEVNVSHLEKLSTPNGRDVLLFPCGGKCEQAPSAFPGKILAFNGESFVKPCMRHLKSRTDDVFFVSAIKG